MNTPFVMDNAWAAKVCGLKPARPIDSTVVNFLGFELTVDVDDTGRIEAIASPDGSDCYYAFDEWARDKISALVVEAKVKAKAASDYDRYEDREAA